MYPDFLVIGAQKAGTTWLYRSLQTHPQVWMPREKELHYFDEKAQLEDGLWSRLRGERPVDRRWRRQVKSRFKNSLKDVKRRDVAWDLKYFLRKPTDKWYASLFEPEMGQIAGETTPDYAVLDRARISHVHEVMPQAKIIFMMRNPIERPWSVADMGRRIRGESAKDVSEKALYKQLKSGRARRMTKYLETLENWGAFYPEDQIFVGFLEDIHLFPDELLHSLYEFLGVDTAAEYRVIKRKVHSGFLETMPTKFAVHLADSYYKVIRNLHNDFGGYASFWKPLCGPARRRPPERRVPAVSIVGVAALAGVGRGAERPLAERAALVGAGRFAIETWLTQTSSA